MNGAYLLDRPTLLDDIGERFSLIQASAGTGKTWTLEQIVLDEVIRYRRPIENILVVTFTDRATTEMKGRVAKALERALGDDRSLTTYAVTKGKSKHESPRQNRVRKDQGLSDAHFWRIDDAARAALRSAWRGFERAPFLTIHGFCHRVLADYPALVQTVHHKIVDQDMLVRDAFYEELRELWAPESGGLALAQALRPAIATRTLAHALTQWGHESGKPMPAWRRDDFKEALATLDLQAIQSAARALISKHDGTQQRALSSVGRLREIIVAARAGRSVLASAVDIDDWRFLQVAPGRFAGPLLALTLHRHDPSRVGPLKELVFNTPSPLGIAVNELLPKITERTRLRKALSQTISYDDLITKVMVALEGPRGTALSGALRKRFPVALVDEFQDTDARQWSILESIYIKDPEDKSKLILIGDPKQAIYGFRGTTAISFDAAAAVSLHGSSGPPGSMGDGNFLVSSVPLRQDAGEPQLETASPRDRQGQVASPMRASDSDVTGFASFARLELGTNYRSNAQLVRFYNAMFGGSAGRTAWGFEHPEIAAGNRYMTLHQPQLSTEQQGGVLPAVHLVDFSLAEKLGAAALRDRLAHVIISQCKALIAKRTMVRVDDVSFRPLQFSDMMLLTRTRAEGEYYVGRLRQAGISCVELNDTDPLDGRGAGEVLAVFEALTSQSDRRARMRALETRFFPYTLAGLDALSSTAVGTLARWRRLAQARQYAALAIALIEDTALDLRLKCEAGGDILLAQYREVISMAFHRAAHKNFWEITARLRDLVVHKSAKQLDADMSTHDTLDRRGARQFADRGTGDAVKVLTMHKSKGLQAPVVFLAGGFSARRAQRGEPHICYRDGQREAWLPPLPSTVDKAVSSYRSSEDARLFYVGLTRSAARLYLPYFGGDQSPHAGVKRSGYSVVDRSLQRLLKGGALENQLNIVDGRYKANASGAQPTAAQSHDARSNDARSNDARSNDAQSNDAQSNDADHAAAQTLSIPTFRSPPLPLDDNRRGHSIYSYTRLKQLTQSSPQPSLDLTRDTSSTIDSIADVGSKRVAARVPGGAEIGIFLHEAIENVPWQQDIFVDAFIDYGRLYAPKALLGDDGKDETHLRYFAQSIRDTIFSDVSAPGIDLMLRDGFAGLTHGTAMALEVDFDIRLEGASVLRGIIDLAFESHGKVYFCDWKSDQLPSYSRSSIANYTEKNYGLQLALYSYAICQIEAINDEASYEHRFGGALYAYLRADKDARIYSNRLGYADIEQLESDLRRITQGRGAAIRFEYLETLLRQRRARHGGYTDV